MTYRVAVGGFQHETNTFAPIPTTYADFVSVGGWPALTEGDDIFERFDGLNLPIGGFLGADEGFELAPLIWAASEPSGLVTRDAFDRVCGKLLARLDAVGPVDAIYLDLHGAMVTDGFDDGEAEILQRLRAHVGPDLPIAVSLDLHANTSRAFFDHATVVTIYRTYPHVDFAETGARAARLLRRALDHGRPLARAWRQGAFILPIVAQPTDRAPARGLYDALPGYEGHGVLSVDMAMAFPPADIPDVVPSIFAYGTDQVAVDAAADQALAALNAAESAFQDPLLIASEAVARAKSIAADADRPVLIADAQDNPGAGAPGDSTGLLKAMIEGAVQNATLGMFWDPSAAKAAHAAGLGAELKMQIGGQYPDSGGPALTCRVAVQALSDGEIDFTGPMFRGAHGSLGPMAALRILDTDADLILVVGTNRCQMMDQAILRAVGVDPTAFDIVAVKSAVHFMADFAPIAHEILFAEAPGANPCRIDRIPYTKLRPGTRLGPLGPVVADQ